MVLTQDCRGDASDDCRLCTGDYPVDFAVGLVAAAAGARITVTREEFTAWLAGMDDGESALRD
ncbi:MAG: hypothetical protein U1E37_05940 [Sphingomonadaceae bacterium]